MPELFFTLVHERPLAPDVCDATYRAYGNVLGCLTTYRFSRRDPNAWPAIRGRAAGYALGPNGWTTDRIGARNTGQHGCSEIGGNVVAQPVRNSMIRWPDIVPAGHLPKTDVATRTGTRISDTPTRSSRSGGG